MGGQHLDDSEMDCKDCDTWQFVVLLSWVAGTLSGYVGLNKSGSLAALVAVWDERAVRRCFLEALATVVVCSRKDFKAPMVLLACSERLSVSAGRSSAWVACRSG